MADEVINIDNDQEETQRKYKRNCAKYSLDEKKAVGKLVAKYNDESSLDDHQENASLPSRSPTHASTPGSSGDENELAENAAPQVDECWMISNGNNRMYATITSVNPLFVKYFETTRT